MLVNASATGLWLGEWNENEFGHAAAGEVESTTREPGSSPPKKLCLVFLGRCS